MSELQDGDSFDLDATAQSFISNAGGLGGVEWGVIAGDTSNFTTNTYLTSSASDLSIKEVANATKGTWGNSIIQLIGNLNSGDATGTEVNNTYGPFAETLNSPNYPSGGHDDWQTGDAGLLNLIPGESTGALYSYTMSGFIGTVTGTLTLDGVALSATALTIGSGGEAPTPYLPDPTQNVVGLPNNVSGDTDTYAVYTGDVPNQLDIVDASTGATIDSIDFYGGTWEFQAAASFADGNNDGMPDDPAIVGVAKNSNTGFIQVKVRDGATGARIGSNIDFFSQQWQPLGIAVLEDSDGNGINDDPAAAVLARRLTTGRHVVEVRRLSDGEKIAKYNFFNADWDPKGVVAYTPVGGIPHIAVLATENATGQSKVEIRRLSDGDKRRIFGFGSNVITTGISMLGDVDGNGTADDPGFVILGKRLNGSGNYVRIRLASNGGKIRESFMINDSFTATGLEVIPDANNSGYDEVSVYAVPDGGGSPVFKIRDLETGSTLDTITLTGAP